MILVVSELLTDGACGRCEGAGDVLVASVQQWDVQQRTDTPCRL